MTIARTSATGGDLDPAFLAWQSSLPFDRRLLEVDVQGSRAHVRALARAKLLDAAEAARLDAALAALPARVATGALALPLEEDVHMAVEAVLRAELGELADKLHTGRSRNDQVALDLALWCRKAVTDLQAGCESLIVTARAWAEQHGQIAMPAYTHRQVAIPVLATTWISAAISIPLARDRTWLNCVAGELEACPLGAGAIAGTTLPIDPEATARDLGFARAFENPIDAVGSRDAAIALACACARISLHLGRFAADIVELASDGLVVLSGAVACGSSMMPHKRNPDLFELVRGQAALRQGELTALLATFHGLGSGYHRDLQQDKLLLFSSVDGTLACLKMIGLGIESIELADDLCLAALRNGDAVATDLCEALVQSGVPFRTAYQRIGKLVSAQRARGQRLVDLSAEDLQAADLPVSLLECLDPVACARRRDTVRPCATP
jgi:argininosuccinate lyase